MRDPLERRSSDGLIVTGASADRILPAFEPIVASLVDAVASVAPSATIFLYGSVATGQASLGSSDVDVLTIGLPTAASRRISTHLSDRFSGSVRSVDIGVATPADFIGLGDEAYGNRAFLRHYCVHVGGPAGPVPEYDFLADAAVARGFNGDIARHRDLWRGELAGGARRDGATKVARRIARKTLLAVAALVSVHDSTWTTDRSTAAARWSQIQPDLSDQLATLLSWADREPDIEPQDVETMLDELVDPVVARFRDDIGLWPD